MAEKPKSEISHPGMMGDGTEEQNLNEKGDPKARTSRKQVEAAFKDAPPEKPKKT